MIGSDQTLNIVIKAKDDASATLDKFKAKTESMGPTFTKMAALGTAAFVAVGAIAVKSLQAFADAEAQTVITNQSLSNSFNNLSKKDLGGLKKAIGGTQDALKGLQDQAQKAGTAAVKMGFDDETAARSFAKLFGVTKDVTKANKELTMAMDLARFKGISLEDATQKLIMVHSGATKELKLMGLAVDDTATAEQNLDAIHKQTASSAENFAKTTKGAMEVLSVQVDNLQESIGAALAPMFTKLLQKVQPVVEKFATWAENNPDLLAKIILVAGGIAGLVAVLGTIGLVLPSIIAGVTMLGTAMAFLAANPIVLIIAAFAVIATVLKNQIAALYGVKVSWLEVWDGIKAGFKAVTDWIADRILWVIDKIEKLKNAFAKVKDTISSVGNSIGNTVKGAGNFLIDKVGGGINSIFEHGGTVPGAIGQAVPIMAHGGETIIPANRSNESGQGDMIFNFSFNGTVAGDEGIKKIIKETIRAVDRATSLRITAGA